MSKREGAREYAREKECERHRRRARSRNRENARDRESDKERKRVRGGGGVQSESVSVGERQRKSAVVPFFSFPNNSVDIQKGQSHSYRIPDGICPKSRLRNGLITQQVVVTFSIPSRSDWVLYQRPNTTVS